MPLIVARASHRGFSFFKPQAAGVLAGVPAYSFPVVAFGLYDLIVNA
jgi:hypothetical protein